MSEPSPQGLDPHPAIPPYQQRHPGGRWDAVPQRAGRHHRRYLNLWRRPGVRAAALITVLALCGLVILALVRDQTGTEGFLVGLGLAVLPVPLLIASLRWLERVEPGPWTNLLFAFAWGAFAAALVAILANSFAMHWIATADPADARSLGATVVAPIVEESAKATAVLLLFLFRRRHFTGVLNGVVFAGFTATGFAFTENILYLGNAFGEDRTLGDSGFASVTAATFFVRIVMSPFAHPLFTGLTGIGFGLAASVDRRRKARRILLPLLGLFLAMGMHALWNGSGAALGHYGFYVVYAVVMVPVFALVTWLAVWNRQRELRTAMEELPAYVAAGWLAGAAPMALGSMRARAVARDFAARAYGPNAAREVHEYEVSATALARLRHRAHRGAAGPDFVERESELLHRLWRRKDIAGPALTYAARVTGRVWTPPPYLDYDGYNPYRR